MNIMGYSDRYGAWPARLGLIREAIEDERPDVIALQSVQKDPRLFDGIDQAHQIANLFPGINEVYFQPGPPAENGVQAGTALLSSLSVAEFDALALKRLPKSEDPLTRFLLRARFDFSDGPLHLYNAYLSWVNNQMELNLAEVVSYLGRFKGRGLLMGDFNVSPDSDALDTLRVAGWTDVWADLHPTLDGFTFFEESNLLKRVDYIWANASLVTSVEGIKILADREMALATRPSDHVGLSVHLSVNP